MDITKRSGNTQKFDRNKLKNSVMKAGANEWDAEHVTINIEKRTTEGTSTVQIKEWVVIELRSIPSWTVAEKYNSYKKQKQVTPMQE